MNPLLSVKDLKKYFPVTSGLLLKKTGEYKAVDGVSFSIDAGETLGLVGESGCGKTTVAKTILGLLPATSGEIVYRGTGHPQMIFQDPYGSLDPLWSVGRLLSEPFRLAGIPEAKSRESALSVLKRVGMDTEHWDMFPHQLSGGQRQRIGIARAIALEPRLIVADEPVSALDVSIQAQIINLLRDLQQEKGLSLLFISHDLSVVRHLAHRVAVMYKGELVEMAFTETLFSNPLHPYTRLLLSSIPGKTKQGYENPGVFTEKGPGLFEAAPGHWVSGA